MAVKRKTSEEFAKEIEEILEVPIEPFRLDPLDVLVRLNEPVSVSRRDGIPRLTTPTKLYTLIKRPGDNPHVTKKG